ncbi:MAG: peptide deformylase [Deltaproteobacteria bacterium]|nr:peptide deformylase [Deltaproteobacteria bacterium]
MVRRVRLFPDAGLKQRCCEVERVTADTVSVIDDLVETMLTLPRCVGLAAPQVGVLERVVVVDVSRAAKPQAGNHGLLCMINPVVLLKAGSLVSREGCVSVPEFTAHVARAERVAVEYLDVDGRRRDLEAKGYEAVALQHEIDHLDGVLFLDRVKSAEVFRRPGYWASATSRNRTSHR